MGEVKWELLAEEKSKKVDKLRELYLADSHKARVVYFNNKGGYTTKRLVRFERPDGTFEIILFQNRFGISTTNKWFSFEKKIKSIIYKGGMFYYMINDGRIKQFVQLTYASLLLFNSEWSHADRKQNTHTLKQYFHGKFTWLRFIEENPILQGNALNTFVRNKLYSYNAAVKHFFKAPLPVVKVLIAASGPRHDIEKLVKVWAEMRKIMVNIENLYPEMLKDGLFMDSCKMAGVLGKKINASWSLRRLKEEHDDWAKEITDTLFDVQDLKQLRIRNVYRDFSDKYGYKLLETNKELYIEGLLQKHCVGTYPSKVDNGDCAIFHLDGFTAEIRFGTGYTYDYEKAESVYEKEPKLRLNQFKGLKNVNAPDFLSKPVQAHIDEFNAEIYADVKVLSKYWDGADESQVKSGWHAVEQHQDREEDPNPFNRDGAPASVFDNWQFRSEYEEYAVAECEAGHWNNNDIDEVDGNEDSVIILDGTFVATNIDDIEYEPVTDYSNVHVHPSLLNPNMQSVWHDGVIAEFGNGKHG
jgi:hypothetical protein